MLETSFCGCALGFIRKSAVIFGAVRARNLKIFVVVEEGAHDAGFAARIRAMADGIMEMNSEPA
ncbi:MAG: hypothetical protein CVT47_03760 [Thermoplasmata archaeon HGW-Thermoplasmata-2]|nr:MAG: hypothetical protein CVT47_03760 [Thermoplasmata archaeon HGW-Thermoplasmata-2]